MSLTFLIKIDKKRIFASTRYSIECSALSVSLRGGLDWEGRGRGTYEILLWPSSSPLSTVICSRDKKIFLLKNKMASYQMYYLLICLSFWETSWKKKFFSSNTKTEMFLTLVHDLNFSRTYQFQWVSSIPWPSHTASFWRPIHFHQTLARPQEQS